MKPETKAQLDDLEQIAKGINFTIENVAISGRPCELHSFYKNAGDKTVTEKIVSETLTKLLVTGLSVELRGMENYVTRRLDEGQVDKNTAAEILQRIHQIRKQM